VTPLKLKKKIKQCHIRQSFTNASQISLNLPQMSSNNEVRWCKWVSNVSQRENVVWDVPLNTKTVHSTWWCMSQHPAGIILLAISLSSIAPGKLAGSLKTIFNSRAQVALTKDIINMTVFYRSTYVHDGKHTYQRIYFIFILRVM
jgi:hypothetical protein